jgi:hypothetical protein
MLEVVYRSDEVEPRSSGQSLSSPCAWLEGRKVKKQKRQSNAQTSILIFLMPRTQIVPALLNALMIIRKTLTLAFIIGRHGVHQRLVLRYTNGALKKNSGAWNTMGFWLRCISYYVGKE